jgi:hypothetical protein
VTASVTGPVLRSVKTKERSTLVAELGSIQARLDIAAKKLRHCLQTVEAGGVEVFGADLRARATELRTEKDQLLFAREGMRQQIDACDTTLLSEKRILEALDRLGSTLPKLDAATQKEFVHLFVERIDVNKRALRPKASPEPVRMLEVTLRLHVPRLVEGMNETIRTETNTQRAAPSVRAMVLETKVDFTRAMHGEVTIHAPYQQTVRVGEHYRSAATPKPDQSSAPAKHPIHTAVRWQSLLEKGSVENRAALAKKFSVTRAGVTQHLQLLKLHPEIQTRLAKLRTSAEVDQFSLNRMRDLARLPSEKQLAAFTSLKKPAAKMSIG